LYYEFITHSIIGIEPISTIVPAKFNLFQNYPNPFNPKTKIRFQIPQILSPFEGGRGMTRLIIYNILGQGITTLVNEALKPGIYEVEWDGGNFASGVYFYHLVVGDNNNNNNRGIYSSTRKMVLLK